jgi:hypothetical protein
MRLGSNQVVTFQKPPQTSVAPSTGNDLVNKTYADGLVAGLTPPTVLTLASDFVSSATALATVTGMTKAVGANETWRVEVYGKYRTAATTTGAGLSLQIPTGAAIHGIASLRQAASGTDSFFDAQLTVSNENYASASVVAANTDYVCLLDAVVVVAGTAGNIDLRWRSEVAASNATLRAGTVMIVTRIA